MNDQDIGLMVIDANLIAQGLCEQTEAGLRFTERGSEVTLDRWNKLSGEDKTLFTLRFLYLFGKEMTG